MFLQSWPTFLFPGKWSHLAQWRGTLSGDTSVKVQTATWDFPCYACFWYCSWLLSAVILYFLHTALNGIWLSNLSQITADWKELKWTNFSSFQSDTSSERDTPMTQHWQCPCAICWLAHLTKFHITQPQNNKYWPLQSVVTVGWREERVEKVQDKACW